VILATGLLLTAAAVAAQSPEPLLRDFRWRQVGPAVFAGRVVDVEAVESDFRTVVAASASGGVWKSVNAGTTWSNIFADYPSASIGDVAIFQRDPNILWVGTGEANNRNSVAWGDGIYKSTDGGKTFQSAGLRDTFQIARIITHPTDPNIVYVAAIGNLWGPSGDRGLFKTTDGGRTWTKLANGLPDTTADERKAGAIDLVMDAADPQTLYVAFYQRLRRPWRFDSGGPLGGIFKTTDAGKTWNKLTNGLPSGDTGRIGLAIYRKNPKIVMAIVEHGFQPATDTPEFADMSKLGTGIYRSEDGGKTWKFVNRYNNRPFYYSQIRINPTDDKKVYILTTNFLQSGDGGRTFTPGGPSFEGGLDFHGMWLDPAQGDRYYLAKDKGLTLTHDHGASFVLFDNMPLAQFYTVGVDQRDPYYVYGGTQDNGTWGGPHFSRDVRGTLNDSWWKLHWGDGMFIQIDPADWRMVYTEAENGSARRYDALTRRTETSRVITNLRDYVPADAAGAARQGWPAGLRFNWRAPLVMSPHNGQTLYLGGNHLLRTVDGAQTWMIISPDLSTNDRVKTDPNSGGLTRDTSGAEVHCTIVAISESPRRPGLLWVGTDDGNVQLTRDGGATWTNVRANIAGVPAGIWVSGVEASHFEEGTAYVTFDGHRSDNFATWIFKTSDYGKTWTSLAEGLPAQQPLYVVREDMKNRNLLFAGSEFAVHASLDGGKSWTRLASGMATVATLDLVIHPRDGDLIAATHGLGFFLLDDITPLQQWNDRVAAAPAHLFEQRTATLWEDQSRGAVRGHLLWTAENPPYIVKPAAGGEVRGRIQSGAVISYYVKDASAVATLEIAEATGTRKRTLALPAAAGLHRVLWDLRFAASQPQVERFKTRLLTQIERLVRAPSTTTEQKSALTRATAELSKASDEPTVNAIIGHLNDAFAVDPDAGPPLFAILRGDAAPAGEYNLRLRSGSATATGRLRVRPDPLLSSVTVVAGARGS
jgi:photosystem II stability/assembly factor-like uncharacterized protein